MINFLINSCRNAELVFHTCSNSKSPSNGSGTGYHLKDSTMTSYPPVIQPSLFPLLPLEKHGCQKRQHSGWKWAPQHLTEHGKSSRSSPPKPWPGNAESRVQGQLAVKGCLLQARSAVLRRTGLRSNFKKRRCGPRLPNNPVQTSLACFSNTGKRLRAAKQHWTEKPWVGESTAPWLSHNLKTPSLDFLSEFWQPGLGLWQFQTFSEFQHTLKEYF